MQMQKCNNNISIKRQCKKEEEGKKFTIKKNEKNKKEQKAE